MASATFKARLSAGTGAPQDITPQEAASLLPVFSSASKGLVPASSGGTTNFLRADGTWGAPAGGGASMTLLGTLNTTSGAVQTLSGLNLNSFQEIRCYVNGVSHEGTTGRNFQSMA